MATIVTHMMGHSGSKVTLLHGTKGLYVQKVGNVLRNKERLEELDGTLPVPKIYSFEGECLEMEYIHGEDMISFLQFNKPNDLIAFLDRSLETLRANEVAKDYVDVYNEQLYWIDAVKDLPFKKKDLIDVLPSQLPQSKYHGDMTLENIIRRRDGKFFFIDPVTVPYDSWFFDIAKLRQDVYCQWFLRNSSVNLTAKLRLIDNHLNEKYSIAAGHQSLLILMLLRVLKHCDEGDSNYKFLISHINKLWTNTCK